MRGQAIILFYHSLWALLLPSPFQGLDLPRQIPLAMGGAENVDKGEAPKDGIGSDKITHFKPSNLESLISNPTGALIYRGSLFVEREM
jgi:hypothetical protein